MSATVVTSAEDNYIKRVQQHVPQALADLKRRKGIRDPIEQAPPPALDRFGKATYYPESTHPIGQAIESTVPLSAPIANECGNLTNGADRIWRCKGCGYPVALCRYGMRSLVRQRRRELDRGSALKPFPWIRIDLEQYGDRGTIAMPRTDYQRRPIVLEHVDPDRAIHCRSEYQVGVELARIGMRAKRGPGETA